MTEAYFYVDIPYHRPAAPSPLRLLQRWAGPLLLGAVLAALAWHQDHSQDHAQDHLSSITDSNRNAQVLQSPAAVAPAAAVASPSTPTAAEPLSAADSSANPVHRAAARPALAFHNCSVPHMTVRKDANDFITGVATLTSCDEAQVTLWDTSR